MGCGWSKKKRFDYIQSPNTSETSFHHKLMIKGHYPYSRLRQKTLFTVKEETPSQEISSIKGGSSDSLFTTKNN
jgi:hypothetical protein